METRPAEIKYRNKDDEHRKLFKNLNTQIKSELNRLFIGGNKLRSEKSVKYLKREIAYNTR